MADEFRVLTWNLFHGRAVPSARRSLRDEFGDTLARWRWDVALLQEVPPWWPPVLAARTGARWHTALTSRNWILPLQRMAAERYPDVLKAGGGGCNAILVRGRIGERRSRRLRWWPERRVVQAVTLEDGTWVANLHATVTDPIKAVEDVLRARAAALQWAGRRPLVVGGDLNVRHPELADFVHAAGNFVDHVFARGLAPVGPGEVLERGALSDHAPVAVTLRRT